MKFEFEQCEVDVMHGSRWLVISSDSTIELTTEEIRELIVELDKHATIMEEKDENFRDRG